jgi:hypothetical protein
MFQPTQFMDGANIVNIDNVPHYRYTGVTYLERLKNGLSFDYVFQQQDFVPVFEDENGTYEEPKSENVSKYLDMFDDYEANYEFYEQKIFQPMTPAKNGKWQGFKKRQARNTKKSTIKSNGYSQKLCTMEQNLPELVDKSQLEIDYENEYDDDSIISYDDCESYYWTDGVHIVYYDVDDDDY